MSDGEEIKSAVGDFFGRRLADVYATDDNTYYTDEQAKYLMGLQKSGDFPGREQFRGKWYACRIKKCLLCKRWFLAKPMQKVCNGNVCRRVWHVRRQTAYWKRIGIKKKREYYRRANALARDKKRGAKLLITSPATEEGLPQATPTTETNG